MLGKLQSSVRQFIPASPVLCSLIPVLKYHFSPRLLGDISEKGENGEEKGKSYMPFPCRRRKQVGDSCFQDPYSSPFYSVKTSPTQVSH